jgi:short subunit fatty acids transporter
LEKVMTFEMFGAGCFGVVIGFVAWHVFRAGEASLDVKQLAAFIAALLGAVVLSAFPAGTTLFAAYSSGLALGFFLVPVSRMIVFVLTPSPDPSHVHASSEVPDQLKYIEEHWPEVERVVVSALEQNQGSIRQSHLSALPLDEAGRVSVLRRYARTDLERTSFGQRFLGWTLRLLERHPVSGERD